MAFDAERCVIVRVQNRDGNTAYVEEDDVDDLPEEQEFVVTARAVAFFHPVENEN